MFNFGDLAGMMKQFQTIKQNVENAKEQLKNEKIVVEVGGGTLKVVVNGLGDVIDIVIDQSLLTDKEVLKDLLISGINEAMERSRELMAEKISQASGLPLSFGKLGGLL